MMRVMMNVTEVIEALGGYGETCDVLGVSRSLLVLWEAEGIPARRWRQIAKVAALKGRSDITIETMCHVEPSKAAA